MPPRTATEDDVDAIRQVAEQAWMTDYPDILTRDTAEEAVNEWYASERIEAELEHDRTILFVTDRDETVVGFAHAIVNDAGEIGYILRLYVHPEHRRANVGRELLERTCAHLSAQGVDRINAMVLAENDPGKAFYDHFGFEHADERETMIGGESYSEIRYVLERPFELDTD